MTAAGATVMRLNSQRSIRDGAAHSTIRVAVTLADDRSDAALAAVAETASELGLTCHVEKT